MKAIEPHTDEQPKDLGDVTLDRLFGAGVGETEPAALSLSTPRVPLWTRAYLKLLGTTALPDESPNRSWREYLVDAFIFSAIVGLLVWIGYLTWRAWDIFAHR
ncbi:MAG TPA: hypothetical protein VGR63_12785 [Casimicrobiaceae bacterium]|jgi:hypothetical protein|nr:hypothetical protein [Casimicrobiaceae bacterium]